jgi:hypothetical protein
VITNTTNGGSETAASSTAAITVNVPDVVAPATPSITTQPQGATYIQNSTAAALTVAATANGTLSYQWYSNTTSSNNGGTSISGATSASYTPSTAIVGTKYYYVVITNTTNSGIATAASNTAAITVNVPDVVAPATPSITTQPQGTTYTQNSTAAALTVAATANGTLSYQWYSNTANSNSGGTSINGATSTSYVPPTATVGTKYYYVVITNTTDGGSETAVSSTAAITVNVPSTPAKLEKPTGLTATATESNVKLTWNAVDGAAAYYIYRSADGGETYIQVSTRLAKNFNGKTPYFDDAAVENGSYIYAIRAYDAKLAKDTRSDEVTAAVTVNAAKLAKPTGLAATPTGNGAKLTWNAVDGAAAYKIYRSADGGKTYTLVSTRLAKNFNGKTPYFDDTTAINSGSYIYAIRAYDSSLSNTTRSDEVTTAVIIAAKLAKPTGLTATAVGNGAKLTWNAVDGAAAYYIYRSADGGKTFVQISTRLAKNLNGKTPYFDDTAVGRGSYIYAIRAYDSSLSNVTRSDAAMVNVTV